MNVWTTGLNDLYDLVKYDGIWIDMNEPTTFWHGEKTPEDAVRIVPNKTTTESKKRFLSSETPEDTWYYHFENQDEENTFELPFIPRYNPSDNGLNPFTSNYDYMTLSLNATLPGLNNEKEYNVHSLYGHMMAKRTQ